MPIEVGIWKLVAGSTTERVHFSPMKAEGLLEDILNLDISILDPRLLLIGRQVATVFGKFIDLLAMDADGKLVVIELKRDRTPREVVAQLLDYGSWVRTLEDEDIAAIFDAYVDKYHSKHVGTSLDQAFCERFGVSDMPETLNDGHELVVVAIAHDRPQYRPRRRLLWSRVFPWCLNPDGGGNKKSPGNPGLCRVMSTSVFEWLFPKNGRRGQRELENSLEKPLLSPPPEAKGEANVFLAENPPDIPQSPEAHTRHSRLEMDEQLSVLLNLWEGLSASDRELLLLIARQRSSNGSEYVPRRIF